jgi:bacterial/archaeal transporter family protein
MHPPVWLLYALIALVFWGITGVTQKLSTNAVSTQLSFFWFTCAMIGISLVIVLTSPVQWHMTRRVFWLAVAGGAVNGLGALTSFAAFEKGGKASIVVPLCYLFPIVTVALAITFLHESLTRTQAIGIGLALIAAILLSQEAEPSSSPEAQQPGNR